MRVVCVHECVLSFCVHRMCASFYFFNRLSRRVFGRAVHFGRWQEHGAQDGDRQRPFRGRQAAAGGRRYGVSLPVRTTHHSGAHTHTHAHTHTWTRARAQDTRYDTHETHTKTCTRQAHDTNASTRHTHTHTTHTTHTTRARTHARTPHPSANLSCCILQGCEDFTEFPAMHFGIRLPPPPSPSPRSPKRRCTSPRPCLNLFSAAPLHWPPLPIRRPIAGGAPMYTRPHADGLACTRTHMHPYAPGYRCGPILYAPALALLQGRRAPMDGCVCVRVIEGYGAVLAPASSRAHAQVTLIRSW